MRQAGLHCACATPDPSILFRTSRVRGTFRVATHYPKAASPTLAAICGYLVYTVPSMRKIFWLILIVMVGGASWFAWAVLTPVEPTGQTFVMLRPGYSTRRIAAELKSAGMIRSEEAFILWRYLHRGRSLKAGEYLFDKPVNIIDIQKRLRRGDVYLHTVVIPEGYTMFDIARAIEAAGLGSAEDFLKAAKSDTSLIADIAPNATSLRS